MSTEFKYTEEVTGEIVQIPVNLLHHHHDNPRKDLGDLTELTDSIKAKGVLQNLTVVPYWFKLTGVGCDDPKQQAEMGYLVVIGNRRLEAAKAAGLETLPCIIAKMTPAEQVQTMLLENMQRNDLTVYEQALGFQMMMDFGDTIDTVAEKTGFSKTTIRRRLKMAELDAETLKSVSDRQMSLFDFDRLAKIEDLAKRNEVLATIGTSNFNNAVEYAIKKQNISKNLPTIREKIKALHANKINYSETYGGNYDHVGNRISIDEWDGSEFQLPTDKKLFYYLDESSGRLDFYTKREKAAPVKRSEEEIEKERVAREAAEKLKEAAAIHFKLRQDFVKTVSVTQKNKPILLKWAAKVMMYQIVHWLQNGRAESLAEAFELDLDEFRKDYNERDNILLQKFEQNDSLIPRIILVFLGDNETQNYFQAYDYELKNGNLPKHKENDALDLIYGLLCDLGYEMSDEEKAIKDGTSELYRADDGQDDEDDEDDELYDGEYGDDEEDDSEEDDSEEDDSPAEASSEDELVDALKGMYGAEE